jgi:hypothetical protein
MRVGFWPKAVYEMSIIHRESVGGDRIATNNQIICGINVIQQMLASCLKLSKIKVLKMLDLHKKSVINSDKFQV